MKKYVLTITLDDDTNTLNLVAENTNFNAAELIGIFELKKKDIFDQICDTTGVKFKRTYKEDSTTAEIEDCDDSTMMQTEV